MSKYVRSFSMSLLFASLAGILGCANQDSEKAKRQGSDEIVIAAAAPMTGKWGEMGNDLLAAVKMAVEVRNASGGIEGRQIRLLVEDDKASPKDAVTVAHKLVADPTVIGLVGHMNSGTMLASSSVYHDGGVPVVMPVPTNPEITKQGFENLFRVPITDDKQGPACATFLLDRLGKTRVAIVHNKDAYGEGIAAEVRKAIEARELKAVTFVGVSADDQDYRAVITQLKKLDPDGIFFGGGSSEAALFIRQSREQGLGVPFVMGDGCFDSRLMQLAGAAADGSYVSNIAPTTAPGPQAQAFYSKFIAQQGRIVAFAPLGYASTQVLLDAIGRAPEKTRAAVLKVLRDPGFRSETILGPMSFGPTGDSVGQKAFMHVVEKGEFKTVAW